MSADSNVYFRRIIFIWNIDITLNVTIDFRDTVDWCKVPLLFFASINLKEKNYGSLIPISYLQDTM